ncbi:MAG: helix-turn-helix transcriptional regulator [Candidatus Cloacimonetes bacterium]|jgi:transcriptional regulator with XRE-family HTH domain|nr:helix-turn-helix transcriptional regulator [Candidatus Cloacimonadota bacterium]MDD3501225.1 helix-turn-helix transcriptional regulator [Candidatus Cloacimonadota bacterium]
MLGDRLRQVRKRLKLTQSELSDKISVSQGTYNRYENNVIEPNMQFLHIFCHDYNVNLNWLITGQGEIFLDNNQDYNSVLNNQESSNKQIKELQKQVNSLKKNIQNIDAEYNQEKKQNHLLNNQIIQLMKDLLECKNQIINLQKKQ